MFVTTWALSLPWFWSNVPAIVPDVVVAVGLLGLLVTGIWALWGEDLARWWNPPAPEVEEAQHGGGLT